MTALDGTAMADPLAHDVRGALRDIPDFPRPGVLFRDITPLLASPGLFRRCTDAMADRFAGDAITHVVAVESRGFIFGAPVAQRLNAALVPVRKPGKLPALVELFEYALEYGQRAATSWRPPMAPIKILMTFGIFLMLLQTIAYFFRDLARVRGRAIE